MEHVLSLIARSDWQRRLVLRGSALMRTQVGTAARPPGDIDWVVLPAQLKATDPSGREIIEDIARLISTRPRIGDISIDTDRHVIGAIWTYERAEGRRLSLLRAVDGLPPGVLQLDFVYGETLAEAPQETAIALGDGTTAVLLAASPALSLCWKLLWLGSDTHPQGKDLYDAVLLAERHTLPPACCRPYSAKPPPKPSCIRYRYRSISPSGTWTGRTSVARTPGARANSRTGSGACAWRWRGAGRGRTSRARATKPIPARRERCSAAPCRGCVRAAERCGDRSW